MSQYNYNSIICPICNIEWFDESEQAACMRVYGHCIVCCVEKEHAEDYQWDIAKVKANQTAFKVKGTI